MAQARVDMGANSTMDDCLPHTLGLCHSHESEPPVDNAVPRAKRLLDSPEQAQVLQPAKKACLFSHQCSTPSEKLLLRAPGSACFQGSSHFPGDSGHADLVASSYESKYDDVAPSLDKARCFDDSEPDDSLLELSDSEQGNSPFSYTEEEIQEILADDCLECEQHITRKSILSQNVSGESEKDVSSSCTGASVITEDAKVASKITEKSKVPLSVQVTDVLSDLDIEDLLNLSPIDADYVDQPLEDDFLEGVEVINDYIVYDQTDASSCFPRESLGWLMPKGEQTPGVDCLGKTSSTGTDVSSICGDHVGRSVPCSDLACGQHKADESAAPVLLRNPQPSSESGKQELPKATMSIFSRK